MRLRKIRDILERVVPLLEINASPRNSNPKTYQLTNSDSLQTALYEIKELGLFEDIINSLEKQSFYSFTGKSIVISDQEYRIIIKQIPELKTIVKGIVAAISQTIDENDTNVVSVKIPAPQNFDELETTSGKLHKIFSQTLSADGIDGGIRIKNFDTGSYWIDIIASSKGIIPIIAGLAWSGVIVFKKLQEGRLVQQQVREMKISNKAIEEIVEKSKEAVNSVADIEANHLYKTLFKGKDNEQVERIKMALKELADLYSKGAEIHPTIDAKSEIKELFPNFEKLEGVMSKIKKIDSKK